MKDEGELRDGKESGPGVVHGVIPLASEASSMAIFFAVTPCDRASATSWRRRRRNRSSASRSAAGGGGGGPRPARAPSVRDFEPTLFGKGAIGVGHRGEMDAQIGGQAAYAGQVGTRWQHA